MDDKRALKIIRESVKSLKIDLQGKNILTEVGSLYYKYLPLIAYYCNANKIYALAKDSKYGLAKTHIENCLMLSDKLNIDNITFLQNSLPEKIFSDVDIITNSWSLRPLDKAFLSKVKQGTVIPLMYEYWELRPEDIDIDFCKSRNIQVAGTKENTSYANIFDYCGILAFKMILESGYELIGNKIIVWSNDQFGETIIKYLKKLSLECLMTNDLENLKNEIGSTDIIFIANYNEDNQYFVENGVLPLSVIKSINDNVQFIHLYGNIDYSYCIQNSIKIYPPYNGQARTMSFTLGHVGLVPILKLQVAGLKVASELITGDFSELTQII